MSIYLGTVKMSGSAGIAGGDASVIASNITLSTTAQPYITINNSSKTIALPATDPYTSARTPASHTHGQLTNAGAITSTAVALASGDSLVFVDSSDSSKVKKSSITFGTSTTTFLRNDGQWATPSGGGGGGSTVTLPSGYSASTGITLNSSSLTTIATIDGTELKLKAPAGGGDSIEFYFDDELDNLTMDSSGRLLIDLTAIRGQRSFTSVRIDDSMYNYIGGNPIAVTIEPEQGYYYHEHYVLIKNITSNHVEVNMSAFYIRMNNTNYSPTAVSVDSNLDVAGRDVPPGCSGLYSLVSNGTDIVVSFAGLFVNQ